MNLFNVRPVLRFGFGFGFGFGCTNTQFWVKLIRMILFLTERRQFLSSLLVL